LSVGIQIGPVRPAEVVLGRLALCKGEGRVRVCKGNTKRLAAGRPLTLVLSPSSEGRGETRHDECGAKHLRLISVERIAPKLDPRFFASLKMTL